MFVLQAARRMRPLIVCLVLTASCPAQSSTTSIQSAVAHAMAGKQGTAVVLDLTGSAIVASYHPEVAARRLALPGSSLKPFTLLALLQKGKVDGSTALMCARSVSIAGHKLDCTHPDTRQPLHPSSALAYSCNSYFTTVAVRLTPMELRDSLLGDGFASGTAWNQQESSGRVELASTPAQEQLQAVGEWGIRVTPLELMRAYASLARLSAKHDARLDPLFAGLEESVSYGMGHAAQPQSAMKVAGKTGTSVADEGVWTHAWFAGYAPADRPQIALVVFLEKGHGGAEAAAVASDIFSAFAGTHSGSGGR